MGYYINLRPQGLEELGDGLHITLAYIGEMSNSEVNRVSEAVERQFDMWAGLTAHVQGFANWAVGSHYYCVGLVGGFDILKVRNRVDLALYTARVDCDNDYPFLPHVTIRDSAEPIRDTPSITEHIPFTTRCIYLSNGDGEHTTLVCNDNQD